MLHYMKQHLTPEVAREHFREGRSMSSTGKGELLWILLLIVLWLILGAVGILIALAVGFAVIYIKSKSPMSQLMRIESLPTITEDICVGKRPGTIQFDGPDNPGTFEFARLGSISESDVISGDENSTTQYDNVYIGQKFYVASWPESKKRPIFYAQDYWRLEALTPEEQREAAELEAEVIDELTQNMDHALVKGIMAKYSACSKLELVSEQIRPEEMTVAERIAVQYFGRCVLAAMEYVFVHHDGDVKKRFMELLNRKELGLYISSVRKWK